MMDVIVIGGGSAGAVLANRLSADSARSVLLLEAGPVYAADEYPEALANADILGADSEHDWGYQSEEPARLGYSIAAKAGKVLGGGSAVNAGVAMRARPFDFERWKKHGIELPFDEALKIYRGFEKTTTADDRWHGRSGPVSIRQPKFEELTPSLRAFVNASVAAGLKSIDDFNGTEQAGVGVNPMNVINGTRLNTGMIYLAESVRRRPNLTIRGNALVDRIEFEGKHAAGVRLADGDVLSAGEVALSAGAYGSPAILFRSGIGPSRHLREHGIEVVADLPVGERLFDHPFYYCVYSLKRNANSMHPASGATIWTRSASARGDELDLHITASHFFDPRESPTGGAIVIGTAVMTPASSGQVRLRSRDPHTLPFIQYNLLADERDERRMLEGVKLAKQIARTEPLANLIDQELTPGRHVATDETLLSSIRRNLDTYHHGSCTVPMGGDRDDRAVVDHMGRVRGVDGLRVIDASIFPEIPSEPVNLTVIMLAEYLSAAWLGDPSHQVLTYTGKQHAL